MLLLKQCLLKAKLRTVAFFTPLLFFFFPVFERFLPSEASVQRARWVAADLLADVALLVAGPAPPECSQQGTMWRFLLLLVVL